MASSGNIDTGRALKVVARLLDSADINLETTRRNIEVSGINLLSLKGKRFRIGNAIFEFRRISSLFANGKKFRSGWI